MLRKLKQEQKGVSFLGCRFQGPMIARKLSSKPLGLWLCFSEESPGLLPQALSDVSLSISVFSLTEGSVFLMNHTAACLYSTPFPGMLLESHKSGN